MFKIIRSDRNEIKDTAIFFTCTVKRTLLKSSPDHQIIALFQESNIYTVFQKKKHPLILLAINSGMVV